MILNTSKAALRCKVSGLDQSSAQRAISALFGDLYWARKASKMSWKEHWGRRSRRHMASLARQHRRIKKALRWLPLEVNERGNTVERRFSGAGIDSFDAHAARRGMECLVHTGYVSVWANDVDHIVMTYAEGDVTEVRCSDVHRYLTEVRSVFDFYPVDSRV